jgi:hypothetical protein
LKKYFLPLIAWKNQKGISSEVISIEYIISTYSGASTQLKIKNCLNDFYNNNNLKWVLLGGDNTIVPVQYCYGYHDYTSKQIPTDLFYACFDKCFDWNYNNNSNFGEIADSIDLGPEVFISRAPIRNGEQIRTFINKTLEYEKNPALTNYIEKMLLAGTLLDESWFAMHPKCKESDSHLLSEKMYDEKIYPYWSGTKYKFYDTGTDFIGDNTYDVTVANFHEQLSNRYHLIHMTSHGDANCLRMEDISGNRTYYTHSNASTLQNSNKFILVTNACETDAFDDSIIDPCFSEALFRNPNGGCVAYWGGSRSGFFSFDYPVKLLRSMAYSADFFYELFHGAESMEDYGFAALTSKSKIDRIPFTSPDSTDQTYDRWIQFSLNAIGDPEMPIFTYNPSVFINATVSQSGSSVTVSTGGISGCRIALYSLDSDSPILSYEDNVSSKMFSNINCGYSVAITKHNYKPFTYLTDSYFQNIAIDENKYYQGNNINIGYDVTTNKTYGNVSISNNANIVFEAIGNCTIKNGFECGLGSTLEIK